MPADAGTELRRRLVHEPSGVEFLLVPAGEFLSGYSPGDPWPLGKDKAQSPVAVSKAFHLSRTEVTCEQFARFRSNTTVRSADLPIVDITRDDAIGFCQHFGFRLPTDAEWEFACRAKVMARFWWGDDEAGAQGRANGLCALDGKPQNRPVFPLRDAYERLAPAGAMQANAFGLCDMLGNVWEMCQEPASVSNGVTLFVVRGGSWREGPDRCRCSSRDAFAASYRADNLGFRVVKDLD